MYYIYAKGSGNEQKLQAGQQVNRVGKYLYKHLDGAYKMTKSPNMCDVYITVLYQIPHRLIIKYGLEESKYEKVNEMTVDLNITTYQNKLRINVIEMTKNERTLGHNVYDPSKLENLEEASKKIYDNVCKKLAKAFEDYEFLF